MNLSPAVEHQERCIIIIIIRILAFMNHVTPLQVSILINT